MLARSLIGPALPDHWGEAVLWNSKFGETFFTLKPPYRAVISTVTTLALLKYINRAHLEDLGPLCSTLPYKYS